MSRDWRRGLFFRRLEQKVREAAGKNTATRYSVEFENSCRLMFAIKYEMERLLYRIDGQVKAHGDESKASNKWEAIGEEASKYRKELPNTYASLQTKLDIIAEASRKMGLLQKILLKAAEEKVVTPLRDWLKNDGANFQVERRNLEKRRLEMDNAQNRLITKSSSEAKQLAAEAKKAHEEQMAVVVQLLGMIPLHERRHAAWLAAWLMLQHDYWRSAADTLHGPMTQINK